MLNGNNLQKQMSTKNKVHAAVKAIIWREDKFLIIKKTFGDDEVWDLPGGKVKYGEVPYDTLTREVKEETTLDVEIIGILGVYWFFRRHTDNDQVMCSTFICDLKDGKVNLKNNPTNEKIIEHKWVTKEEFLSDKYPADHDSLKDLIFGL